MAQVFQLWGRDVSVGDDDRARLKFIIQGAGSEASALADLAIERPATFLGLEPRSTQLREMGGGVYEATVEYRTPGSGTLDGQGDSGNPPSAPPSPGLDEPLSADFAFDTSGRTERITQSLETTASAKVGGGAAPDFARAIGVSKDNVAGTDKVVPHLEFTITREFHFVTPRYVLTLRDLTGSTNDAEYLGFEAGELLFLGGSGQTQGERFRVTTKFLAGKNKDAVIIIGPDNAPVLQLVAAGGGKIKAFEYQWAYYKDDVDGDELIQTADAAYSERIAEEGNFGLLGVA